MLRFVHILSFVFIHAFVFSQNAVQRLFPKSAFTLQYAGSTGFLTAGVSKATHMNKLEVGLLYGFVPRSLGGVNHSLNLKITYDPFEVKVFKRVNFQPIQTGIFLSQNFNKNLALSWGDSYPSGYYWWTRSLRLHVFLSTQVSLVMDQKYLERISFYIEANTNDLYLYSYLPNRKALSLYDILFLGTGIKVYLK